MRRWVPHDCTCSRKDQTPLGRDTREVRGSSSCPLASLQVTNKSKTSRSLESFNFWHADCCRKQIKMSESNIKYLEKTKFYNSSLPSSPFLLNKCSKHILPPLGKCHKIAWAQLLLCSKLQNNSNIQSNQNRKETAGESFRRTATWLWRQKLRCPTSSLTDGLTNDVLTS